MKTLATVFKALSEETRLEIMALLVTRGELCVCDVETVLDISQSKSSRHLRYLLGAGLVDNRRVGVWMYYRVPEGLDPVRQTIVAMLERVVLRQRVADLHARLDHWLARKACAGPVACGS